MKSFSYSSSYVLGIILFSQAIANIWADPLVTDQVYFDVGTKTQKFGRIVIGLFGEELPQTVKNFYTIATTGIDGKTYANVPFHRVIKKFMIQACFLVEAGGTSGSVRLNIYGFYGCCNSSIHKMCAATFSGRLNCTVDPSTYVNKVYIIKDSKLSKQLIK